MAKRSNAKKSSYLSASEAARELGLSGQQVRRMADQGKLAYQDSPLGRLFSRKSVLDEKRRRERSNWKATQAGRGESR